MKQIQKIFFFLFIVHVCHAVEPFVLMSNPKSGTMYLRDILSTVTKMNFHFHYNQFSQEAFGVCHCIYEFNPHNKTILLYRDPREMMISYAHFVTGQIHEVFKKGRQRHPFLKEKTHEYLQMSMKDKIRYLFDINNPNELKLHMLHLGERVFSAQDNSDVLCVKFEELTGPKGGGDAKLRWKMLDRIRNFLKLEKSTDEIVQISEQIWGKSSTFRRGKINTWKEFFDDEMCEEIKNSPWNQLIVDLGYEKTLDW